MDIDATAAGAGIAPWIVLGVVLGVLLAGLVALGAAALRRPRRLPPPAAAPTIDDLPGFREAPPGFPGARRPPAAGWVGLAPAPPTTRPAIPATGDRPAPLLAGLAAGVLLLLAAAALVAGLAPAPAAADRSSSPVDEGVTADAGFAGLVLERRAVGVTVTTPRLRLTTDHAEVTLPTWNCLADEAPADPASAGCARTETEYAELSDDDLDVERDGDTLRITGRFATETRPNGSPPEETGRVYPLAFTLRPDGDGGAVGEVRLGDDTAPAVGP